MAVHCPLCDELAKSPILTINRAYQTGERWVRYPNRTGLECLINSKVHYKTMKKQLIGFILPFLICALMPLRASSEHYLWVISFPGSGAPGDTLTYIVEVRGEAENPVSGQTVTFSIISGDGNASLSTTSATTDSNGRAQTTLTLGSSASGSYTVKASISNHLFVNGIAIVETSPPPPPPPLPELSISVVSGPGSGAPGDALTFTVEVQEDGSAASGKTVTFNITSGDGNASLGTTSTTTGSNGRAQTTLTLGGSASGSYTITATVGSKSTSGTATVETSPPPPPPPPPLRTLVMTSSPYSLDPGDSTTFTVTVKEGNSAVSGATVTFSVSPDDGTVSLSTTSTTTDSNGEATVTLTTGSDSSGSYTVTASVGDSSVSRTAIVETSSPPPPPPPELSISVVSGPGSGAPGDALTFIVEVQENGSAASGKTVTFSITSGDGNASLGTTSITTGSNGRAQTTLTLGNSASGSYTITATVGSTSVSGTATAETSSPPPPSSEHYLWVISFPGSGAPGDTLIYIVEVRGEAENPVSGQTVTFSIISGDGNASLSTTSATTGSNGRAQTTLTLGSSASGSYTVKASISNHLFVNGIAIVETSPSPPPPPLPELLISVVSGPGSGAPGDALTFTVEVQEDGSAASGKTVTFNITSGDGNASLSTTSTTTGSNGRAQTTLTLGGSASGSYTITATVGSKSTSGTATVEASPPPPPPPLRTLVMSHSPWPLDPGESMTFTVTLEENGSPAQDQTVMFSVSPDDGTVSLSTTSTTTDSNGEATVTLTTGSDSSGSYTVTASVGTSAVNTIIEVVEDEISELQQQQSSSPTPMPTALAVILDDDPSGLTGEGLPNPFVVEVRDQNGDPLEGVTVTFTVSAGGGSLSDTSVETDVNGLAQSTLTLGSEPGTNTVDVSVEEVTETATFTAVAELLEFDLSVPSGISLIHVPLRVKTVDGMAGLIESVADLYNALGGVDTVNWLITYNSESQDWDSYFGDADRGMVADRILTDHTGILASIKTSVSVRLGGDALGVAGSSTITLNPGLNLVGLPLKDSRVTRVSDLFALEGIADNAAVIIVSDKGEFKAVGRASDPGDIEITGGQSFILTAQGTATVSISGDGWDNTTTGTMDAPPMTIGGVQATGITPVLALNGSIVDGVNGINSTGLHVIVENLSTGSVVTTAVEYTNGIPSQVGYRLTVVDIADGRAAAIGDTLEISVRSPDMSIGVQPLRYTVTVEDIKRHRIHLPELVVQEIPAETELLRNYPNPFNPETWIPYRLAEDAFVTLSIYDGNGQVVRTLDIGHQAASIYESRSKAVYWDGRNDLGESVASGLYFYTLTAGDFSATRKMLILK